LDLNESDAVAGVSDAKLRRLEEEHVHDVYEAIAPHFSATRYVHTLLQHHCCSNTLQWR
jgi:hypothetical protein